MSQITIQQAFELALRHHRGGRLREAGELYQQILGREPGHVDAIYNLGLIARAAGRNDVAIDLFRRAVGLRPDFAEAYCNLGSALSDGGPLDEAIAALHRAIAINPSMAEAFSNLGNALRDKGELDEAIAAHRKAISLRPHLAEAHSNLAIALIDKGSLDEAIAACRQAILLRPNFPEALNVLGGALRGRGRTDEAIAAYGEAIKLWPNYAQAYSNLGNALRDQGRLDEAVAAFQKAIAIQPDFAQAHGNLGNALKDRGQLDEAFASYRQAIALKPSFHEAHSDLVFAMHYHPAYDAADLLREHLQWNEQHARGLEARIQEHLNERLPERRLRVGYVSGNFHRHPVGLAIEPLIRNHDRGQVEVFCFYNGSMEDEVTGRIRAAADHWHSIAGMADQKAAELIRENRIDVLVDLSLHMGLNRMLVFARKPAPVQVTYLGYPGTTGLPTMDYRLSDPWLDPVAMDEFYTEKTIRLPRTYLCWRWSGGDEGPAVQRPPASRNGHTTFGSLNNFCKVTPEVLQTWGELLKRVADSRLLLRVPPGETERRVRGILAECGVEENRVSISGRLPWGDYVKLLGQMDIGLDPFPYPGHTTSLDALWMGVPVVTLGGRTAAGRGGVSILRNLGLPELIASDEKQYIDIAAGLAADLPRLEELRGTLRQRIQGSALMDEKTFARDVEEAYRGMWRRWCAVTG